MKKVGAYRICERCGREKPLDEFIGRLHPEYGPGMLCRTCLCKKALTSEKKKEIKRQKTEAKARRRRKVKACNARAYRKLKLESEMWIDLQYSKNIAWHGNVLANSKLWREYITNGGVPLDSKEWHEYRDLGGRYLGALYSTENALDILEQRVAKLKKKKQA